MPLDAFSPVGFLFIGDPHVCSTRIGRRKDDYTSSVLDKLDQAAALCAELRLLPIITGDLLHRNDDSEIRMLNRFTRTLKRFPVPPIVLEGNHDRGRTKLSDDDVLQLLAENGLVRLTGEGEVEVFDLAGSVKPTRLWACPYGAEIPTSLPSFDGATVMLTHHDMAFGSAYPGAAPLTSVTNCDMVVNGHMHDTKESVYVGATWWHNPGNIEPLSVDLASHVPSVWSWVPGQSVSSLTQHALQYEVDVFDLGGLEVPASAPDLAVATLPAMESSFARMLVEQSTNEAGKTEDMAVLMEDLQQVLSAQNASDAVRKLMMSLTATAAP